MRWHTASFLWGLTAGWFAWSFLTTGAQLRSAEAFEEAMARQTQMPQVVASLAARIEQSESSCAAQLKATSDLFLPPVQAGFDALRQELHDAVLSADPSAEDRYEAQQRLGALETARRQTNTYLQQVETVLREIRTEHAMEGSP